MKRPRFCVPSVELREEFPASAEYIARHSSALPDLVELRLTTGQGTMKDEMVLVGEMWAGETVLFDQKTGTEVAVWFDNGRLKLRLTGCDIKSGSRFGERLTPEPSLSSETLTTELAKGSNVSAQGHLSGNVSDLVEGNPASLRVNAFRNSQTTKHRVTRRESSGSQSVVAMGSGWHIKRPSEGDDRNAASPYKYISTEDRLCDLTIRPSARAVVVEAQLLVFPNDLRYRIRTAGALKKLRGRLSTNQNKIIQLLLKSGIAPATTEGLSLAKARLRRRRPITNPKK